MGKKRDSAYFKGRLKRDYPGIYADLQGGKFKSVREAAIAAGLIREQTALQILKREWRRASRSQQVEFIEWLKDKRFLAKKSPAAPGGPPRLVDPNGILLPHVVADIQAIMTRRRLRPANVCQELGFSRYDYRWRRAFERLDPAPAIFLAVLPSWLVKNRI